MVLEENTYDICSKFHIILQETNKPHRYKSMAIGIFYFCTNMKKFHLVLNIRFVLIGCNWIVMMIARDIAKIY